MSDIEWTDTSWNPLRGCWRISPGCEHCYAERQAARPILSGPGLPYEGLVTIRRRGPRWTGATAGPDRLDEPLRWKKPRKVFVCSMSDLFYEGHTDEEIAAVFGVMAGCPQHTFQVLTKRAERMAQWFEQEKWCRHLVAEAGLRWFGMGFEWRARCNLADHPQRIPWPLPNVWLGVSVEDQQRAQERLPRLLRVPAAVRFVSYEPALEAVDFRPWLASWPCPTCKATGWEMLDPDVENSPQSMCRRCMRLFRSGKGIDWLIVGGESGPGARLFDLAWARSAVAQCRAAGVPCFVKQMGARPIVHGSKEEIAASGLPAARAWEDRPDGWHVALRDRKGGDPSEWPADLQVREWPGVRPC